MAERIQVELVDDIDGSRAQHTVTFALDGVSYEIDLNERHARDLRSVFARYIESARGAHQSPRTTKQQEREERRARQTNRQLTEQIRGAAQRSRELHKQEQDEAPEERATEADVEPDLLGVTSEESSGSESATGGASGVAHSDEADADEPDADEATSGEADESGKSRVPAVSLPHFSSASD